MHASLEFPECLSDEEEDTTVEQTSTWMRTVGKNLDLRRSRDARVLLEEIQTSTVVPVGVPEEASWS